MKTFRLFAASALASASVFAFPSTAFAQAAPTTAAQSPAEDDAEDALDDQIIVTGSRIPREINLDSPIPVISVSAEEILDGGDVSLGDSLSLLRIHIEMASRGMAATKGIRQPQASKLVCPTR